MHDIYNLRENPYLLAATWSEGEFPGGEKVFPTIVCGPRSEDVDGVHAHQVIDQLHVEACWQSLLRRGDHYICKMFTSSMSPGAI